MSDPYLLFGVAETADDAEINKVYLQLVRRYPPERAPLRFQQIRAAYEKIKTQRDRLAYELFNTEPPDLHVLFTPLLQRGESTRPTEQLLKCVLAAALLHHNQG